MLVEINVVFLGSGTVHMNSSVFGVCEKMAPGQVLLGMGLRQTMNNGEARTYCCQDGDPEIDNDHADRSLRGHCVVLFILTRRKATGYIHLPKNLS